MLSVNVCSKNRELFLNLKENISSTIGVEFEINLWDNSIINYGICEVYNKLANNSKYDLLLFLHEDLKITTQDWGKIIITFFNENKDAGMIGVAGSKVKSKYAPGWYSGDLEYDRYNIFHSTKFEKNRIYNNDLNASDFSEVVCLDGVFLAIRKNIWSQVRFNDQIFKGFHFYDIDFSLRASRLSRLFVCFSINIIHFTEGGDYGEKWLHDALIFNDSNLGKETFAICKINRDNFQLKVVKVWLWRLKNEPIKFISRVKWITYHKFYFFPFLYFDIFIFLFYRLLGLQYFNKLLNLVRFFKKLIFF